MRPFTIYRDRYQENFEGSRLVNAKPAIFQGPRGDEPGVVIFKDRYILAALTIEDATRVSNEIIDATERPAC